MDLKTHLVKLREDHPDLMVLHRSAQLRHFPPKVSQK